MSTRSACAASLLFSLGVLAACGGSDGATEASAGAGNAAGRAPSAGAGGASAGSDEPGGAADAGSSGSQPEECEPLGHFGTPTLTFTLPEGTPTISYPDVQKSFPDVDWQKLERLYVPAGKYKTFQLGNLPKREADSPLVITNLGGQVQVGPNLGGNFIWSIGGGSNWVLTGRYDAESKTGDEGFPGHRCGAYADSRGTYGFLSDDAFDHGSPYLHMGISIGDGATDFELEFLEVTRSGFAGIRLLNSVTSGSADPKQPMANVRVHDTYVHDVDSEGFYFGWTGDPPSNLFPGLQIYDNRIVRTGSETLQIQDLGEGSHIHHNVFAYGALHWLDNFAKYQDGNLQILVREGNVEFDHNLTIGGAGTFLSFFSSPEAGDGPRNVTFHDNYFADTRSLGGYLNGSSEAGSSFTFSHNFFRGFEFSYQGVDPTATDPGVAFGVNGAHKAPVVFSDNSLEAGTELLSGIALNGSKGNISATGNTSGEVEAVTYVASGFPDVLTGKLSAWGATASLAADKHAIQYAAGDLVMFDAQLYQAKSANTGKSPAENPTIWQKLPTPADDLRVAPGSTYEGLGVR